MKEVKISSQFLEKMLITGNEINVTVIEGLDERDKIVAVTFDEHKRELTLWCDTDEIVQQVIRFERNEKGDDE